MIKLLVMSVQRRHVEMLISCFQPKIYLSKLTEKLGINIILKIKLFASPIALFTSQEVNTQKLGIKGNI